MFQPTIIDAVKPSRSNTLPYWFPMSVVAGRPRYIWNLSRCPRHFLLPNVDLLLYLPQTNPSKDKEIGPGRYCGRTWPDAVCNAANCRADCWEPRAQVIVGWPLAWSRPELLWSFEFGHAVPLSQFATWKNFERLLQRHKQLACNDLSDTFVHSRDVKMESQIQIGNNSNETDERGLAKNIWMDQNLLTV